MKCINQPATEILNRIAELATANNGYTKIDNTDGLFTPLSVEWIDADELTICHYGEMNGDLMCNPEVIFTRKNSEWFPHYFRNDFSGVEQTNANGESLCEFSEMWLSNIETQQSI